MEGSSAIGFLERMTQWIQANSIRKGQQETQVTWRWIEGEVWEWGDRCRVLREGRWRRRIGGSQYKFESASPGSPGNRTLDSFLNWEYQFLWEIRLSLFLFLSRAFTVSHLPLSLYLLLLYSHLLPEWQLSPTSPLLTYLSFQSRPTSWESDPSNCLLTIFTYRSCSHLKHTVCSAE